MLKLQEMKQEPLNEKKQKKNFNCNFIFEEKIFVFILYLLVNFFKGSGEKYMPNEGGHSDLMSALRGGFQNLMHAYQGGGGVKKPQKYAYVICESPLIVKCYLRSNF